MVSEVIFVIEESPEGGFTGKGLGHAIFTEADTPNDLREAVRDAASCRFKPAEMASLIRLHYVREEVPAR